MKRKREREDKRQKKNTEEESKHEKILNSTDGSRDEEKGETSQKENYSHEGTEMNVTDV